MNDSLHAVDWDDQKNSNVIQKTVGLISNSFIRTVLTSTFHSKSVNP